MRKTLIVIGILLVIAFIFFVIERTASGKELAIDTDGDGCSDAEELRFGMNPENPYDFMDVPPKDGMVRIADIVGIVNRYGLTANDPDYFVGFDRSSDFGPPDGLIRVSDILLAVNQYGQTCTEVEWCDGNIQEMTDPEGEALDGTTEETVCYTIRDDAGQIVDYLIVTDETSKEGIGEETLSDLPPDLPDQDTVIQAASELGLDESQTLATSPFLRFWSCEKSKTWKDFFRILLFKIKLHVDFKEIRNAGWFTGLVNVYNTWGSQRAWLPWNVDRTPAISKSYVYTDNGPWDFKIIVYKEVGVRASLLGHNITYRTLHAEFTIGPGASCYWRVWRD